jgi:hypothetical protein
MYHGMTPMTIATGLQPLATMVIPTDSLPKLNGNTLVAPDRPELIVSVMIPKILWITLGLIGILEILYTP